MDGSAIQHDHIKLEQKQRFNFIDNHEQTKNGALSKYYLAMFRWQSHNFASPPFLMRCHSLLLRQVLLRGVFIYRGLVSHSKSDLFQ